MVGKQLFKVAGCVACHKLNHEGQVFGPDLAKLGTLGDDKKKHSPAFILESILNPSKDIDKKFQSQVFVLDSGKIITGMIVEETANSIRLQRSDGTSETVLRIHVETLRSTGLSFMPEGLEKEIDLQSMADLLAYLRSVK
jgi:putative heme-binding domain-containing protein